MVVAWNVDSITLVYARRRRTGRKLHARPSRQGEAGRGARDRRDVNIINIGGARNPRYYPPAYYDRWTRNYYRWSPIRYAPWGLIYGSIGLSSYGVYGGWVDDFDGTFQSLPLEAGGHKIEIHLPGYEDLELDVHVQPGCTITLHEDLTPRP